MVHTKIHPDPTRIKDSVPINIASDFEGEYAISFKQELPSRDIVIPFSLLSVLSIENITIDIGGTDVLIPNNNDIKAEKTPSSFINNGKEIFCFKYDDLITIGSSKNQPLMTNMTIYSISSHIINKPYLGIGRSSGKTLVDIMFSSKLITAREISILYSYPDWGTITFGKQSLLVQNQTNLSKSCQVIETQHKEKWACNLEGIFFGDTTTSNNNKNKGSLYTVDPIRQQAIKINAPGYFETLETYIISPYLFIQFLKKNYFKSYLLNNTCYYEESNDYASFYCKRRYIESMDLIAFSFGQFGLYYFPSRLFIKENDEYSKYAIVGNIKDKNNKDWILGYTFMNIFHMTFSHDNNTISFFSLLGKVNLNPIKYYHDINDEDFLNDRCPIKQLLILSIMFVSIGLIYISYVYYTFISKYI